jgi:hypothetical protein
MFALALLILQDVMPVKMGQVGSVLSIGLNVILAALLAYVAYRSTQAKDWRGTAEAHKSELDLQRGRAERLEMENRRLVVAEAELKAKTDLSELQKAMLLQSQDAKGYETRNQEVHLKIVDGLSALIESSQKRYDAVTVTIRENTQALNDMGEKMSTAFIQFTGVLERVADDLDASHRRADNAESPEHGAAADAAAKSGRDLVRP